VTRIVAPDAEAFLYPNPWFTHPSYVRTPGMWYSSRLSSDPLPMYVVCFTGTLYWLVETMTTFGGLATPLAVFAAGLLVAYLSLFPAAFAVILARVATAFGTSALAIAPAVWVATELGRQYVWDGFPWTLLGSSQVTVLPIAQVASVAGVYGLSGMLAAAAAVLPRDRWASFNHSKSGSATCATRPSA